jgi:hypothetical protein
VLSIFPACCSRRTNVLSFLSRYFQHNLAIRHKYSGVCYNEQF